MNDIEARRSTLFSIVRPAPVLSTNSPRWPSHLKKLSSRCVPKGRSLSGVIRCQKRRYLHALKMMDMPNGSHLHGDGGHTTQQTPGLLALENVISKLPEAFHFATVPLSLALLLNHFSFPPKTSFLEAKELLDGRRGQSMVLLQ